ncbi:MAG TPA: PEGA domain-containing protein [Thermoanaerobaculia bacterium]|nr:PEGA domain-containing protein [Thermoanaerobaculia bacterium]
MTIPTRESFAWASRAAGVGLALIVATSLPLAAQSRSHGHTDGSAGEAPHARSEPGGDRGSWNHGGSPSGGSGGGSGSISSGGDGGGSTAQPRSSGNSPGGDRSNWSHRGGGHGDRGHHSGHSGGGRIHLGFYPYYWNPWWSSYWWGWDGPYYGGYGGYGYGGYGRYDSDGGPDQGALDLDVAPGDTQVFLDGQNIGTVDDYDGFPRYLWLEKGTYDLVFYREGYQTLARQYSIYPGLVVDVSDRLVPGQSIRPQDLETKTHVRRDTRVLDERERAERIDAERRSRRDDADEQELGEDDAGRPRDRGSRYGDSGPAGEQGRLQLTVEPDDASVYLDGRFLGTGESISRLHRGLLVEPGQHRIAVVRPGRRGVERQVTVAAGGEEELSIVLDKGDE